MGGEGLVLGAAEFLFSSACVAGGGVEISGCSSGSAKGFSSLFGLVFMRVGVLGQVSPQLLGDIACYKLVVGVV